MTTFTLWLAALFGGFGVACLVTAVWIKLHAWLEAHLQALVTVGCVAIVAGVLLAVGALVAAS